MWGRVCCSSGGGSAQIGFLPRGHRPAAAEGRLRSGGSGIPCTFPGARYAPANEHPWVVDRPLGWERAPGGRRDPAPLSQRRCGVWEGDAAAARSHGRNKTHVGSHGATPPPAMAVLPHPFPSPNLFEICFIYKKKLKYWFSAGICSCGSWG